MKKLFKIMLIATMSIMIISCKKEISTEIENHKNSQQSIVDPSNPSNEYDYIGEIHNIELIKYVDSMKLKPYTCNEECVYDLFYVQGLPDIEDFSNIIQEANYEPEIGRAHV